MLIDKKTQSLVSKYVVKKGGMSINNHLEEWLKKLMESVHNELKAFVGYDILLNNCNYLSLSERYAQKFGISRDFHLLGQTGYTFLFYKIDASTMDCHTEIDWSMMTIYVPNQDWMDKPIDYLQFFHLADSEHGIIHVSMQPGMIIYFHRSLLMHQQLQKTPHY